MDVNRAIRMAVDTGSVSFGARAASKKNAAKNPKMVVLAKNCPRKIKDAVERCIKDASVPVITFEGTSIELGSLCGKPFPVSTLTIIEPGNSNILEAVKKE